MEDEILEITTKIRGDVLTKYRKIKEVHGLTTDAETVRLCIAKFPMNGESGE